MLVLSASTADARARNTIDRAIVSTAVSVFSHQKDLNDVS